MEERKSGAVANAATTVPENDARPAAVAPDVPEAPESAGTTGATSTTGTAGITGAVGITGAAGGAAATGATGEEAEDWQRRCQTAEESLAAAQSDAKDYYRLAARYGEAGPDAFSRFVTLRRAGLAPEEAFGALLGPSALAASGLAPSGLENNTRPASKAHLLGSAPKAYGSALPTMSSDELRLARSLLGEELSTEELEALYRRVVT